MSHVWLKSSFLFLSRLYLNKMSLVVYTSCRIRFRSNGKSAYEREYSDRTLLELRQYDFNDYSLRALDMENNRTV